VRVTITQFRRDLFRLVERALAGEPLEFTYRGVVFKVESEVKPSRLARLTGQPVVARGTDLEKASRELLQEMQSEWETDWAEL
jgi:antitoxin (DNA-binding transcriptional repressor) of toxin-antitoxin stability system